MSLDNSKDFNDFRDPEASLIKQLAMEGIREESEKLKNAFMGQVESKLNELTDDIMNSLEKIDFPNKMFQLPYIADNRKTIVNGKLQEKLFRSRPSPLTYLLDVPHFKTIHHIFIATLALIMLHTIILDYLEIGTIDLGFGRIMWAFGSVQNLGKMLFFMHFSSVAILYPGFYFWATYRQFATIHGWNKIVDSIGLSVFVFFLLGFIYFPASFLWKNRLPPASGAIITMEQCRLLMKMYAFVRSNIPRALNQTKPIEPKGFRDDHKKKLNPNEGSFEMKEMGDGKMSSKMSSNQQIRSRSSEKKSEGISKDEGIGKYEGISKDSKGEEKKKTSWISWNDRHSPCPDFSKYLYFLFAPTLIYKDNYPRTSNLRWSYVLWNFLQVGGCIIYANFLFGRFCASFFVNFGHPDHPPMSKKQFVHAIFSLMLPGIVGMMLGFFLLLHTWQNAFAELLHFGDRLFYKDWWLSSTFSQYYRSWNILVHDWLFLYIFKDVLESKLGQKYKTLPTVLVFGVSALFHEYILAFSLNFFFPVLLILFGGFGFAFNFIKSGNSGFGNILMWMGLISGTGIMIAFYSMEYYARINCPQKEETSWDFFNLRFIECKALDF